MKPLIFLSFVLVSFGSFAQYPDKVELQEILDGIAAPLASGDRDSFLQRVTFPFEVGDKKYSSKSQLIASFDKAFIEGYSKCLSDPESYQIALPNDHTWYLAVSFVAPTGYDASVFSFRKINGTWMLDSIDIQKGEE